MHEREAAVAGGVARLFDAARGCETLSQRIIRYSGTTAERCDDEDDELLYVLEGEGRVSLDGEAHPFAPGTAVFVPRGTRSAFAVDGATKLVSVLVHDPEPAGAPAVVDLATAEKRGATAGREFVLGAGTENGCRSATQFVGLVPPGRAPDHFHTYDEVVYVLDGEGTLEIGGERAPLAPGSCVHLPARLVHCLTNDGGSTLRLLGVFRPAGSPAEAYYPDGTPALVGAGAAGAR
jgi:quercetin dioxygenase-like cupin family protein